MTVDAAQDHMLAAALKSMVAAASFQIMSFE